MGTPQDYRELEFKSGKLLANSLVSKVSQISIKKSKIKSKGISKTVFDISIPISCQIISFQEYQIKISKNVFVISISIYSNKLYQPNLRSN